MTAVTHAVVLGSKAALFVAVCFIVLQVPKHAFAGPCDITGVTWPGNEAYNPTIPLQMPFIAGQPWRIGGTGSFYGNNLHCNQNNDYYATDWNRTDGQANLGSAVLPVAKGTMVYAACAAGAGYGCSILIDHANGFRTRYAHLNDIALYGGSVDTWNLLGHIGQTGTQSPHFHLSFLHNDGGFFSHCWNYGLGCINGNPSLAPQGYRPSPMMTASGPVVLTDNTIYTSVNGRVQLPDLRPGDGWGTNIYLRNDSTEYRNVTVYYYTAIGGFNGTSSCPLNPNQMCILYAVTAGTQAYVDGAEAVSVAAVRYRYSGPMAYAMYTGISRPDYQVLLPLVHKNNWGTSSKVMIKNASTTADNATIRFQTASGEICPQTYYLNGNAAVTIDVKTVGCIGNGVYGVRITSSNGQPLAVVTTQEADVNGDGLPESVSDYEGFANGAYSIVSTSSLYPLLMRDNYGAYAGIMLQNPNASSNTISIYYYWQGLGGYCCSANPAPTIGAYGVTAIYPLTGAPSMFVGGGAAYSGSGLAFNSIVNQIQSGGNQSMSYAATSVATTKATVPVIFQNYAGWGTGISIQNGGWGPGNATARVFYYDQWGNLLNTVDYSIPPSSTKAIYPLPLANYTIGSAVVATLNGEPISVVANQVNSSIGSADGWMSSTGINR